MAQLRLDEESPRELALFLVLEPTTRAAPHAGSRVRHSAWPGRRIAGTITNDDGSDGTAPPSGGAGGDGDYADWDRRGGHWRRPDLRHAARPGVGPERQGLLRHPQNRGRQLVVRRDRPEFG